MSKRKKIQALQYELEAANNTINNLIENSMEERCLLTYGFMVAASRLFVHQENYKDVDHFAADLFEEIRKQYNGSTFA